jgi:parallel beta-helix repeat protein
MTMLGFVFLASCLTSCAANSFKGDVYLGVGVDPRVVVRSHPAGSTFVFASGVHRLSGPIVPRDGDVFVGEVGAVLSGARLLTSFGREGGLWVVSGQTQQGFRHGSCTADAPRCSYPEDLFMDDVPLRHVASLSEVVAGAWFFDYDNDRIYFADDPTGRVVETSVATAAISGDADDVTVRDLIVEKFANPARPGGAINTRVLGNGGSTFGERWVIEDNTVRLNHSMGINAGHGARIRNNRVLWNGQLGLGGGGGQGTLIEGNEIAYNNWAGFDWGWEAGGTKWAGSDGLIVRNNHSHHNSGPGLWTDIDNIRTLYEHNLVEHNTAVGIFHEVSFEATIRHNTVRHNGIGPGYEQYVYVYGSGILVSSSSDVTIHGNVLEGNWGGIAALQGNRGTGRYGAYHVRNLHVYDNYVEMTYWEDGYRPSGTTGVAGMTGLFRNGGPTDVWDTAANNRFERNLYVVPGTSRHWSWRNSTLDFAGWQAYGNDVTGTMLTP